MTTLDRLFTLVSRVVFSFIPGCELDPVCKHCGDIYRMSIECYSCKTRFCLKCVPGCPNCYTTSHCNKKNKKECPECGHYRSYDHLKTKKSNRNREGGGGEKKKKL